MLHRKNARLQISGGLVTLTLVSACAIPTPQAQVREALDALPTTTVTVSSSTAAPTTMASPPSTEAPSTTTTSAPTTTTTTIVVAPGIEGAPAPDFTVALEGGGFFSLADQTQPVVLVFWAIWCNTCHKILPFIDAIAADYGEDLVVLGIVRESDAAEAAVDFAKTMPSGTALLAHDSDLAISQMYSITGVPITVLVLGGTEAQRWLGSFGEAELREAIDELLALY